MSLPIFDPKIDFLSYSRHNDDASDDEKSGKEDSKDDSKEDSKEETKKDEDEEDGEVNDPNDILEKKRNEVWVINNNNLLYKLK